MTRRRDDTPSDGALYAAHSRSLLTDEQNAEIDAELARLDALLQLDLAEDPPQ